MMTLLLYFSECEHNGDQAHYAEDIAACGGQHIEKLPTDRRDGVCAIRCEVPDKKGFMRAFAQTDSYAFLE